MTPLVQELAEDRFPVAVTCQVLNLPRSSYYDALSRPPSTRAVANAELNATIRTIHADSRDTYGAPRVNAELRHRLTIRCGLKRVARLMRAAGLVGCSTSASTGTAQRPQR